MKVVVRYLSVSVRTETDGTVVGFEAASISALEGRLATVVVWMAMA